MSKSAGPIYYTQCRLQNGPLEQTAWLPKEFAVLGKMLDRGMDHWKVVGVGATQLLEYLQVQEEGRRGRAKTIKR